MSYHFFTKNFGKFDLLFCSFLVFTRFWAKKLTSRGLNDLFFFLKKWTSADLMTFFLVFTCFWTENWTGADMMTLKEPILLLRSDNMLLLFLIFASILQLTS